MSQESRADISTALIRWFPSAIARQCKERQPGPGRSGVGWGGRQRRDGDWSLTCAWGVEEGWVGRRVSVRWEKRRRVAWKAGLWSVGCMHGTASSVLRSYVCEWVVKIGELCFFSISKQIQLSCNCITNLRNNDYLLFLSLSSSFFCSLSLPPCLNVVQCNSSGKWEFRRAIGHVNTHTLQDTQRPIQKHKENTVHSIQYTHTCQTWPVAGTESSNVRQNNWGCSIVHYFS